MKKINKTWVLIIILIILTAVLLVISITSRNTSPEAKTPPTISKEAEKEIAFTTLTISGEPRVSTISGRYEVDVIINTDKNEVTATQIELVYDPNTLTIYDINPGSFMTNPEVLQKNIDADNGRVSFWLAIGKGQSWVQGEGAIATITFAKIGTESAEISFSPKSSVSADGINDSALLNTFSGFINELPTNTPFPTVPIFLSPTPGI